MILPYYSRTLQLSLYHLRNNAIHCLSFVVGIGHEILWTVKFRRRWLSIDFFPTPTHLLEVNKYKLIKFENFGSIEIVESNKITKKYFSTSFSKIIPINELNFENHDLQCSRGKENPSETMRSLSFRSFSKTTQVLSRSEKRKLY